MDATQIVYERFAGDVIVRHAYRGDYRTACGQAVVGNRWEQSAGLSFTDAIKTDRAHCFACKKALERAAQRRVV